MTALLRFLFVIPIAFVLACLAAGFAMLWPFMNTNGATGDNPLFWAEAGLGLLAQTAQVGSIALMPWAAFMVASEVFGVRSLILHMVAGIAAGFGVIRTTYGETLPQGSVQTAMIVASLTFALVYWIFAGRGAGRWRRRERALSRPAPPRPAPAQTVETAPEP